MIDKYEDLIAVCEAELEVWRLQKPHLESPEAVTRSYFARGKVLASRVDTVRAMLKDMRRWHRDAQRADDVRDAQSIVSALERFDELSATHAALLERMVEQSGTAE